MHLFYEKLRRICNILWSTIRFTMLELILEISNCPSAFSFASPKENEPGGISISLRPSLNRPRKPLRFSWIFPAEFVTAQNYAHPKAPPKGELSAKLTERSQQAAADCEGLSANPQAFPHFNVGADAGHSRSRRRSSTDVGLPLAGTHRPGSMHRVY